MPVCLIAKPALAFPLNHCYLGALPSSCLRASTSCSLAPPSLTALTTSALSFLSSPFTFPTSYLFTLLALVLRHDYPCSYTNKSLVDPQRRYRESRHLRRYSAIPGPRCRRQAWRWHPKQRGYSRLLDHSSSNSHFGDDSGLETGYPEMGNGAAGSWS